MMDQKGGSRMGQLGQTDGSCMEDAEKRSLLSVFELTDLRAKALPAAAAVLCDGAVMSYAELEQVSIRWAQAILDAGARPGDPVLVCLHRRVELPAILLGVMRAGCAYVPVDAKFPADRIAIIREDSGAALSIVEPATRHLAGDAPVLEVGKLDANTPYHSLPAVNRDDNAYIIFTSGSTGRPKGVPIRHEALTNFLLNMARRPGLNAADRVLALTTISFDISILELFLPLVAGATVILATSEEAAEPSRVIELIRRENPSLLQGTPATWRLLMGQGWLPDVTQRVLCGGEAFPVDLAKQLLASAAEVWNMYGPTEATVWVSCHKVSLDDCQNGFIPLGTPIDGAELLLVTDADQIVDGAGQGELLIGGSCLSAGYWQRPDLTELRFSQRDGGRYYRTGDQVERDAAGSLRFCGRLDNQVKIRGFRIELGEVEAALNRIDGIRESAVLVMGVAQQNAYLVACICADRALKSATLESILREQLPEYMVPRAWHFLPELPLTPNRKVDRRALAAQLESLSFDPQDAVPDFGDSRMNLLAELWRDVLGRMPTAQNDDFFALGGHSLAAAELAVAIESRLGRRVTLADVMSVSGLGEQADLINRQPRLEVVADVPAEPGRDDLLPFTPTQQRLWLTAQFADQPAIYHESEAVRLRGPLQETRLKSALAEVLAANDVFRLRLVAVNGEPHWRQAEDASLLYRHRLLAPEETSDGLASMLTEEADSPFDLAQMPAIRFVLYRCADNDHILQVTAHHLITDGLSQVYFWQQLAEHYANRIRDGVAEEREPFWRYIAKVRRQNVRADGEFSEESLRYWQQQLSKPLPTLDLVTDTPRPAHFDFRSRQQVLDLPGDVLQHLTDEATRQQTTPFVILLACYVAMLARHSGQTDFVVGMPVSGRTDKPWRKSLGLFINTLPLRIKVNSEQSLASLVATLKSTTLAALRHQDASFEQIVEAINPDRDQSRTPLFQTLFTHNDLRDQPVTLDDCEMLPLPVDTGFTHTDLVFFADQYADRLQLRLQSGVQLFTDWHAGRFLSDTARVLDALLDNPAQSVAEVRLLTDDDVAAITRWNQTSRPYPRERSLFSVFAEQVSAHPDNIALEYGEERFSYRQLHQAAEAIGNYLLSRGVGPRSRVGILGGRSPRTIVAILGTLRVGAAYVPIDTQYPEARIRQVLDDAHVEMLLLAPGAPSSLDGDALAANQTWQIPPLDSLPTNEPAVADTVAGGGEDPAYVMFTSGSTGVPKGIEVTQRNVLRLVQNTDFMPMGPDTRFLMYAPIAFDASTLEIWAPLLNGGTLIIPDREAMSAGELAGFLRENDVNALWLTAALFQVMAEYRPDAFAHIDYLLAGGDVLATRAVRRVLEWNPQITLINGYGPTENTTFSCCYRLRNGEPIPDRIPIGRPVANSRAYVLDTLGTPCPPGVPGELVVAGDGVAVGYVNAPELDAKCFADNVAILGERQRVYRTGDMARWLEDGTLEFLGRRDQQVKIRGFRVELHEIENVLEQVDGVEHAAVVAPIIDNGRQLVAFLVVSPQTDKASLLNGLPQHLKGRLPNYMVPSHYAVLDHLPVDNNGKLNRRELLAHVSSARAPSTEGPAGDLSPTEQTVAAIWRSVLHLPSINPDDDFFDLGGTSLAGLELFAELEKQLGRNLPLSLLLEARTIRQLARCIDDTASRDEWAHDDEMAHDEEMVSWANLVMLHNAGRRRPIVCIHAVGGNVIGYKQLFDFPQLDRTVLGFQSTGLNGLDRPMSSIQAMAQMYVEQLLGAGFEGPFTLLGGSMGGTIAVEMAAILESQGHGVEWVIMLDTLGPAVRKEMTRAEGSMPGRVIRSVRSRTRYYWNLLNVQMHHSLGKPLPYRLRPFLIESENIHALMRHEEHRYGGDVLLLRAPLSLGGEYRDPLLGWQGYLTGRVLIHYIDAPHKQFLESSATQAILARFLSGDDIGESR